MLPLLLALPPAPAHIPATAAALGREKPLLLAQAAPATPMPPAATHPYFSLQLGVAFPNDYVGDFDADGIPVETRFDLEPGFNGEVAIGYQFERARAELALGYGQFAVASQSFQVGELGRGRSSSDEALSITTAMVNGYLDIPIHRNGVRSRWTPYLGAGIGYANISTPDCGFGSGCFQGANAGAFAYQGKVGVAYRTTARGSAFLEGGYLGATGTVADRVDFENFGAWRLNLGWRQGFGGAPKAVVPVAQVETAPPADPAVAPEAYPAPAPQPIRGLW